MALPYPKTLTMPVGDSRTVRWPAPRDYESGEAIDPAEYDAIRIGFAAEGEDQPRRSKITDIEIESETDRILVEITAEDTEALGPGRWVMQLRLEQGSTVRHTMLPLHFLELVASPLSAAGNG